MFDLGVFFLLFSLSGVFNIAYVLSLKGFLILCTYYEAALFFKSCYYEKYCLKSHFAYFPATLPTLLPLGQFSLEQ